MLLDMRRCGEILRADLEMTFHDPPVDVNFSNDDVLDITDPVGGTKVCFSIFEYRGR